MKKILFRSVFVSIFSILWLSFAGAELGDGDLLSRPKRIFEFGIDSDTAFANSSFGLKDVLKKNIEIDLQKISKEMPDSGFMLAFQNKEKFFANLNVSSRFRFGFFTEVESSSRFNISKDLFKLLADGISLNDSKTVDVTGYADVFANIGASFQTIISGYGVKITPTYFIPIVYVPKTTATASLTTSESGLIKGEAEANVDIYTAVDMHDFMENGKHAEDIDFQLADILSNGGFDLSLEVERNWFHNFNAGLYTRLPVIPGRMKHKMSTRVWAYFYETNVLGYLDNTEEHEKDHGHDDFTYSSANYKVHRPMKLGLNATYMPFGSWFKIQPQLGFAVRNPYTSDAIFYPEYALDLRFSFLRRIFNFNLGTAYQNQMFQQRFGFSLNFRMAELMAQASLCGTNLKASFSKDGYGVLVGVRMGF